MISPNRRPMDLQTLRVLLGDPHLRPGFAATAYDTAWVASVPAGTCGSASRFPASIDWLIEHQLSDGSWGGSVRYEHDRVLSTLTALTALARFERSDRAGACIDAGTRYLWLHGRLLSEEPMELVSFELLLPALIRRAQDAGLHVPPGLDIYEAKRAKKLRMVPAAALGSRNSPLVHSLEFLGDDADPALLKAAQGENGSLGNSPATTAFFLSKTGDAGALHYLESCLDRHAGAAASVVEPCETFELLWSAYHLFLAGVPAADLIAPAARAELRAALQSGGVSFSPSFPVVDADDTAVALVLLHDLGEDVDPAVLQAFALSEGHFATYPHERHSSVGTNLHVLHALLRVPGYPDRDRTIEHLLDYVIGKSIDGTYWLDKWHISPYYATAHALRVFAELPSVQARRLRPLVERARAWLHDTQRADGSWGFYDVATAEETAYGMLAIAGTSAEADPRESRTRAEALRRLNDPGGFPGQATDRDFPPLWIEKCLYTPTLIVQATIQAALLIETAGPALEDRDMSHPRWRAGVQPALREQGNLS